MRVIQHVRSLLRRLTGFDVIRYVPESSYYARRIALFRYYGIDLVIDVGANVGQFGKELRALGYKTRIVSFEPIHGAYRLLQACANKDGRWETFPFALGDFCGSTSINISADSASSSLLVILPALTLPAPEAAYVGMEIVEVRTLDSLFAQLHPNKHRIYLKIDTQGYESSVLKGALISLQEIDTVQLEMSLVPLYRNEETFFKMCAQMTRLGYEMIALDPGFTDPKTGRQLQTNGVFHRP